MYRKVFDTINDQMMELFNKRLALHSTFEKHVYLMYLRMYWIIKMCSPGILDSSNKAYF